MNDLVTIITRKPLAKNYWYLALRFFRHPIIMSKEIARRGSLLGGHLAVTSSLLRGLDDLDIGYIYEPIVDKKITRKVIVLSDAEALKVCVGLKEKGLISSLFAGPNIMVKADDFNRLYSNSNIDKILVPSKWVEYSYEFENPDTKGRIFIWPSGIDFSFWEPNKNNAKNSIILYEKYPMSELKKNFYEKIKNLINLLGYELIHIKYGEYDELKFKSALEKSIAMIYVSKSESQGIALLESWAMNVPTFVWDTDFRSENGRVFKDISAAPYLSSQTGLFWSNMTQLKSQIESIDKNKFEPREYSINKFSDRKSAEKLINEINTTS